MFHEDIQVKEDAADRHKERRLLNEALDHAMVQLEALENRLRQDADADKAAIFAAHREILRDPDLLDIASSAIDKGKSAAFAWRRAYTTYADRLAGLEERAARPARDRRARRRPARPGRGDRAAPREAGHPRGDDPRRRGPHAVGHRLAGPDQGGRLLHAGRRRVVARRDPCPVPGHPGGRGHRAAGAGPRRRHPGDPRRRQGHAADERHRGRRRPDPAAPGAARGTAGRGAHPRQRAGRHRRRAPRRGGRQHRRP